MKDDYRILDATCGRRIMWIDPRDTLTTYIDCNSEKWPDYTISCMDTPFPDRHFDLIVFDPPHLNLGKDNNESYRYGTNITAGEIRQLLKGSFIEFRRILKPFGLILFKWNTRGFSLTSALKYLPCDLLPLFGNKVMANSKTRKSTYWICIQYRAVTPKTNAFDMQSIQSIIDNVEGPGIIKVDALG